MRADQYIDAVLRKCENLQLCGLWPPEPRVRPKAWLANFEIAERAVAATLLDHFIFFGAQAVDSLLVSGFRALRERMAQAEGATYRKIFEQETVFVAVEGEDPNTTDSGHLICRKLRQIFSLPERRFVAPEVAVEKAASGVPVVFVDDFIGSGDQFMATWTRKYRPIHASPRSFSDAHGVSRFKAMYLALVSTEKGRNRIAREAPMVSLGQCHVLSSTFGVDALPRSSLLPDIDEIPKRIGQLLDKHASELIVPRYISDHGFTKHGYDNLGLQIAFDHSTPDATLPIFWAEARATWTPLVRRS